MPVLHACCSSHAVPVALCSQSWSKFAANVEAFTSAASILITKSGINGRAGSCSFEASWIWSKWFSDVYTATYGNLGSWSIMVWMFIQCTTCRTYALCHWNLIWWCSWVLHRCSTLFMIAWVMRREATCTCRTYTWNCMRIRWSGCMLCGPKYFKRFVVVIIIMPAHWWDVLPCS